MACAASSTESMPPLYMNAPSGTSSCLPSMISLKERTVSSTGTNTPGVPVKDTVRGFREILDGKWDHLPEQAFYMVGGIEEAAEQAEKMEKEATAA